MHHALAYYDGYCVSCDTQRPLVLVEHGPRGLKVWLSGVGSEDRALSYTCRVCGQKEHVPATEQDDAEYDATLPRWPDFVMLPVTEQFELPDYYEVAEAAELPELVPGDIFYSGAVAVASRPMAPVIAINSGVRQPVVRILTVPSQRMSPADARLIA